MSCLAISFEQWFDIFQDETKELGYSGPIDKESIKSEYHNDKSPESSAKEFVKEMKT